MDYPESSILADLRTQSPLDVACPRANCRAGAGQACDRRTLAAYQFHSARVDAWASSRLYKELGAEHMDIVGSDHIPRGKVVIVGGGRVAVNAGLARELAQVLGQDGPTAP